MIGALLAGAARGYRDVHNRNTEESNVITMKQIMADMENEYQMRKEERASEAESQRYQRDRGDKLSDREAEMARQDEDFARKTDFEERMLDKRHALDMSKQGASDARANARLEKEYELKGQYADKYGNKSDKDGITQKDRLSDINQRIKADTAMLGKIAEKKWGADWGMLDSQQRQSMQMEERARKQSLAQSEAKKKAILGGRGALNLGDLNPNNSSKSQESRNLERQ